MRRLDGETFAVYAAEQRVGPTRRSSEAADQDRRALQDFFVPGSRLRPLLQIARRQTRGQSCPYCRDELRHVEVTCSSCGTELHADCASEHGGCTSAGCGGRLRPVSGRAA